MWPTEAPGDLGPACLSHFTSCCPLPSGLPWWLKPESAFSVGDLGSIPESGRFPEEGNGSPPQYSCLENPMDREAGYMGLAKSQTQLSNWHTHPPSLPAITPVHLSLDPWWSPFILTPSKKKKKFHVLLWLLSCQEHPPELFTKSAPYWSGFSSPSRQRCCLAHSGSSQSIWWTDSSVLVRQLQT